MDFPGECAERRLWSSLTIEKNDWYGVERKGGGQLGTNGVKLYSVTSHKLVFLVLWCGDASATMA